MYPKAFIDYLVYFHSFRDYFECHEVLEEHWKKEGKSNRLWVGLIQLAVSMYHHRRDNYKGAEKQINQAIKMLEKEKENLITLGIDSTKLIVLLKNKQEDITKQKPYSPIDLPILDKNVIGACLKSSQEKGVPWGDMNINVSNDLIHKHKLRDRSQIIQERLENLKKKRKT